VGQKNGWKEKDVAEPAMNSHFSDVLGCMFSYVPVLGQVLVC